MLAKDVQPGDLFGYNGEDWYYRVDGVDFRSDRRLANPNRVILTVQYFDGGFGKREFAADQEIEGMTRP